MKWKQVGSILASATTFALLTPLGNAGWAADRPVLVSARDQTVPLRGGGAQMQGYNGRRVVSQDGRFVLFRSSAPLSGQPTFGFQQVFVRDTSTGITTMASLNSAGSGGGNGDCGMPTMSADGSRVAFSSFASNLASPDSGAGLDVFVRDLNSATTILVSVDQTGTSATGGDLPKISDDGTVVAFASNAPDIVSTPKGNISDDVYVRNLTTGTTILASVNTGGTASGNGFSTDPILSADGSTVVFRSQATDLAPSDGNGIEDLYVRRLGAGTTHLLAVNQSGEAANGISSFGGISSNGNRIGFTSDASDLVPGDTNGVSDVFVHDLEAGITILASVGSGGGAANGNSVGGSLDAAGTVVMFSSTATDLATIDTDSDLDLFYRDLASGVTQVVNLDNTGTTTGNGAFAGGVMGRDGTMIAFLSEATDLTPGDLNGVPDLFVRDLVAGTTVLATPSSVGGGTANGPADLGSLALADDGRSVVFVSSASDLVVGDTGLPDVFQRRLDAPQTVLVSEVYPGSTGDAMSQLTPASSQRALSDDGRYLVFESFARDLVPNDGNSFSDVFVRDLVTGVTELVSVSLSGVGGDGPSFNPTISADGARVAFRSEARNLVSAADTIASSDIFVRDLPSGVTSLVSVSTSGAAGSGNALNPAINADGTRVAFQSNSSNLVPGDANLANDVFVRDLVSSSTILVSVNSSGTGSANGASSSPQIDHSGSRIAFVSSASNLVNAASVNGSSDVFLRDLANGVTHLVSMRSADTGEGSGASTVPVISADGRRVAFQSVALDLVAGDLNNQMDVFVRDLASATTHLASINMAASGAGNGSSSAPAISANGTRVAFQSLASDLVGGDANGVRDTFVRDLTMGVTHLVSVAASGVTSGNGGSAANPAISADGSTVAFASSASNLVSGDGNGTADAFVRDLGRGTTTLLSLDIAGASSGNGASSSSPAISAGGQTVAFRSAASNLVGGDLNSADDVFAFWLPCGRFDLAANRWKMMSLPCAPYGSRARIADLFGDDLDQEAYGVRWSVWRRDEPNNRYERLASNSALDQSEGYWIISLDPVEIDVIGSPTPVEVLDGSMLGESFEQPMTSSAPAGVMNLLGHPLPYEVDWADVRFVDGLGAELSPSGAEAGGVARKVMWKWNGGSYDPYDDATPGMEGTLGPFDGFWVRGFTAASLRIPASQSVAMAARGAARARGLGRGEWYVRLTASGGGLTDRGNVLGQLETAEAGRDRHDLEELPPFGNDWLSLVFPHPEWGGASAYASDYRSLPRHHGFGDSWRFEVRSSDPDRYVTLRWEGSPEVLRRSQLVDLVTGKAIQPNSRREYNFTMEGTSRAFAWVLRGAQL